MWQQRENRWLKFSLSDGCDNGRKTDIVVKAEDFTVNAFQLL